MRRAVGLSVAAVVLSITLGVLVGLVIHTGMQQRADRTRHPVPASQATDATTTGTASALAAPPAGTGIPAWAVSITPITEPDPTGGDAAALAQTPAAVTVAKAVTRPPDSLSRTAAGTSPTVTATTPPSTSSTSRTSSASTTGTTHRTAPTSTPPARPGHDAAGGACASLGAKSATADGTSLYCQHDQRTGALRWRAVTDGGGCLNQQMTGVGTDGHDYACQRDSNGLNYWRRTG